jgi:hypothetical protein
MVRSRKRGCTVDGYKIFWGGFKDPDVGHFLGLGGPGGPGDPSERWGALEGSPGPPGPPRPTKSIIGVPPGLILLTGSLPSEGWRPNPAQQREK